MNPELRKALAFFAAVGALALVAGVFGTRVLGLAAGPDAAIIKTLKDTETGTFRLRIAGTDVPLEASTHRFDRIVVDTEPSQKRALATTTLDFEGSLGSTKVSSVGVEQIPFVIRNGEWVATTNLAPRLTGIVSALEARRRALESGGAAALTHLVNRNEAALKTDSALQDLLALRHRRYEARAWFIRSEKDLVLVTEEYRLQGETPDRPVDDEGRRSLVLKESGGEFFFASGLM